MLLSRCRDSTMAPSRSECAERNILTRSSAADTAMHRVLDDADPLRVLRAIRFAARFGFELDPSLVEAAALPEVRVLTTISVSFMCEAPSFLSNTSQNLLADDFQHLQPGEASTHKSGDCGLKSGTPCNSIVQLFMRAAQIFRRQQCGRGTAAGRPCANRRRLIATAPPLPSAL